MTATQSAALKRRKDEAMSIKTYTTLSEARDAALRESEAAPSLYFWIYDCFGWAIDSAQRLPVYAPSDGTHWSGRTGSYWKAGKERDFSDKQRIADQNATPTLS
jgi:hypothetical protein